MGLRQTMKYSSLLQALFIYYLSESSVASAISSARSRTRIFSSRERGLTASSIIVMQNGHPAAIVWGAASLIWSKRF